MPFVIFLLLALALALFWISAQQRRMAGLPTGKIISSDTSRWLAVEKPLYAPALGLTGKPDYLIQQGKALIPVEVKSTHKLPPAPYDGHILQLAAYCLLVEAAHGRRPPQGVLHYTDGRGNTRTYTIPFTPQLEQEIRLQIAEMQTLPLRGGMDRSHDSPARCAACGYRAICDQALADRSPWLGKEPSQAAQSVRRKRL